MKYESYITIPNQSSDKAKLFMLISAYKSEIKCNLKNGITLLFQDANSGLNGEDFRYDRISVRIKYTGYRIPRFLKTLNYCQHWPH